MEMWLSYKREMSIGIGPHGTRPKGTYWEPRARSSDPGSALPTVAVERSELPQISCAVEPPAFVGRGLA